jgi:hypothetical protein
MAFQKTIRSTALAACLVCAVHFVSGCSESDRVHKSELPSGSEQARVTSPNGQFDAVLVRDDGGGAAGGWEWYVYIVPKGNEVDDGKAHAVFNAGTLTGGKLVWGQPHLLEIQYDIAEINQFTNIWGSSQAIHSDSSSVQQEYLVEIRLSPSHPVFSLLTPDGQFRPKE